MAKHQGKSKHNDWAQIHGGKAFVLPSSMMNHDNFVRLSPHAIKLICDLGRQFSGANNGYLHPGFDLMRRYGWRSAHTLQGAIRECVHYRMLRLTRQGGKNRAAYYALTFRPINDLKGRPLDVSPTLESPNDWLTRADDFDPRTAKRATKAANENSFVQSEHKICAASAQVIGPLVQPVHKLLRTCAARAQVSTESEPMFVQPVHSIKGMPYPGSGSGAPAADSDSAAASGLQSKLAQTNTPKRRPLESVAVERH